MFIRKLSHCGAWRVLISATITLLTVVAAAPVAVAKAARSEPNNEGPIATGVASDSGAASRVPGGIHDGPGFDKRSGDTGPDQADDATCEQTPGIETLF